MTPPSIFISLPEAARRLGIPERTARDLAKSGKLLPGVPVYRIGARWHVKRVDLTMVNRPSEVVA